MACACICPLYPGMHMGDDMNFKCVFECPAFSHDGRHHVCRGFQHLSDDTRGDTRHAFQV